MRISDWSSDVCSSDLNVRSPAGRSNRRARGSRQHPDHGARDQTRHDDEGAGRDDLSLSHHGRGPETRRTGLRQGCGKTVLLRRMKESVMSPTTYIEHFPSISRSPDSAELLVALLRELAKGRPVSRTTLAQRQSGR